jgi:hypothetical protein
MWKPEVGQKYLCVCEHRTATREGDVLKVVKNHKDFNTVKLQNISTGYELNWAYEKFPDDFKLVKETAMKKQFIDVEKYALENEIPLSVAHEEIQTWLFKEGYKWTSYGNHVGFINAHFLELNIDTSYCITWENEDCYNSDKYEEELMFSRQVALVPFYNKIDKTEYVEFNGKQYDKKKLEEALAMIESTT